MEKKMKTLILFFAVLMMGMGEAHAGVTLQCYSMKYPTDLGKTNGTPVFVVHSDAMTIPRGAVREDYNGVATLNGQKDLSAELSIWTETNERYGENLETTYILRVRIGDRFQTILSPVQLRSGMAWTNLHADVSESNWYTCTMTSAR
jgi:hypothetical protein